MGTQLAPPDAEIVRFASGQHHVVHHEQLVALGFSHKAIWFRVQAGRLWPKYRGVYAVGRRDLTFRGEWMAAVLASGEDALLGYWSGGRLWGFAGGRLRPIHVVAQRGHVDSRPGIRDHRTRSLHPEDRDEVDGIPVTSVARTLLDLACVVSWETLRKLWEEAIRIDVLDQGQLERMLARTRGRRGRRPLARLLAEHFHLPDDTRIGVETEFAQFLRDRRFPLPAFNVLVDGKLVDAYYADAKLVIELHSRAFHGSWEAQERDTVRFGELQLAGQRVLPVTPRRLRHEADELEATLRRALGVRIEP